MTNNIIQFPKTKSANSDIKKKLEAMELSRVHYESIASEAIDSIAQTLAKSGYHPLKEKIMIKDMGVIMNMLVAMMYRVDNEVHFLQEPMDEIHDVLKYVKELNEKKMNELFTDGD